jgi:transposase InsO family protein
MSEMEGQLGAIASMSRKGDAYDNAVVESFFSNLKNELVHHRTFATRDQARGPRSSTTSKSSTIDSALMRACSM